MLCGLSVRKLDAISPNTPPDLVAYDVLLGRYTCQSHNPPASRGAVYKMKGKMKQTTSAVLMRNGTPHTYMCSLGEPDSVITTYARAELPLCPHG